MGVMVLANKRFKPKAIGAISREVVTYYRGPERDGRFRGTSSPKPSDRAVAMSAARSGD